MQLAFIVKIMSHQHFYKTGSHTVVKTVFVMHANDGFGML